ncbi:MAG: hypothetical protein MJY44_03020 [Bacteroidales bacterium]|nr:hypothetical protein [Bacteroidales bacterium]
MNNTTLKKILAGVVFPVIIIALVLGIVNSIMKPVRFNKQTAFRESVGIQRLKDIRTLQVAYKSVHSKYTESVDTLVDFYNNGNMVILMQIGSADDSSAVAHTDKVKKANRKIKPQDLYEMYLAGDKNLVFSVETKIPVSDTLFKGREDFRIDSLRTIPFSGGVPVEMEAVVKLVSGVNVPLFEARMPYKLLLKGLDNQLRINLDAEKRNQNRFEGLQVGSVTAPNNNAGNWE